MVLIKQLFAAYCAWKADRRKKKAARDYRRGYEWAIHELDTGSLSPFDVEVYYGSGVNPTVFDRGAQDGTDAWCLSYPDQDDRIFKFKPYMRAARST